MSLWKRSLTVLAAAALLVGSSYQHEAEAAKKRRSSKAAATPQKGTGDNDLISSDPGAATWKEHRLLKWGAVDPPDRGKNPEFFVRGTFLDIVDLQEGDRRKDFYNLKILPIEVMENDYRVVTLDHFVNGLNIPAYLPKDLKKQFKKGGVVEVRLFYTTKEEQTIGHAKMIAFSYNEQIVPYPTSPASYIKIGGLEPEQYLNALKGMQAFGNNPSDGELKTGLDALASSSPHPEVKTLAGQLLSSMFNAQPSGQALLPPPPPVGEEVPVKGKKKKK